MKCSKLCLAIFGLLVSGAAKATNIMTTNDPTKRQAVHEFGCRDRIYIVVDWNAVPKGDHRLLVLWTNPQGEHEQTTEVPIKDSSTFAWLELSGGLGSTFSKIFAPERGYQQFIGEWKAAVFFDEQNIGVAQFSVAC